MRSRTEKEGGSGESEEKVKETGKEERRGKGRKDRRNGKRRGEPVFPRLAPQFDNFFIG